MKCSTPKERVRRLENIQQSRKVKFMKKKILLIISMCLIVLGLTACGKADPTTVDYNGHSYDELKQTCEGTVTSLREMTDEQKQVYLAMAEMTDAQKNSYILSLAPTATEKDIEEIIRQANLIIRWDEAVADVGEFVELGDFTITKSGKTLTCEQEIIYENRPVLLSYVYQYYNMELEDIGVEAVQTLGEKMTNAALNTLMGMGVVFVVLILISLIIFGFKIFPYLEEKKKASAVVDMPAAAPAPAPVLAAAPAAQAMDDLELTAVIAAAIAASTGTSTSDFVVRSIKRR